MKSTISPALAALVLALAASCASPTGGPAAPPFEGISDYMPVIDISYYYVRDVNAYLYDVNNLKVTNGTISVDGTSLGLSSDSTHYYTYFTNIWAGGSTHSYVVKTKDGQRASGNFTVPSSSIAGVTYNPAKGTLATSYSVSPPAGGWPTGAIVRADVTNGGSVYPYVKYPTGSSVLTFDGTYLTGASAVSFSTGTYSTVAIEGYRSGAKILVDGSMTSW